MTTPAPDSSHVHQTAAGPRIEQPTNDLRVVVRTHEFRADRVVAIQRRVVVSTGPVQHIERAMPPADRSAWCHFPGVPLAWIPVTSVWKDLPTVTEGQLAAERAAAGETPQISTHA